VKDHRGECMCCVLYFFVVLSVLLQVTFGDSFVLFVCVYVVEFKGAH
jgi:hypothetical protein